MIQAILGWFSSWKLIAIVLGLVSVGGMYTYGYQTGKQDGAQYAMVQCESQKAEAYKAARERMIKEINTHDKRKRKTKALTDAALDTALAEWMRVSSTSGNTPCN